MGYTAWQSVVSQFNQPDISTKHGNISWKSNPNIPIPPQIGLIKGFQAVFQL
jgi:hypothetical protein